MTADSLIHIDKIPAAEREQFGNKLIAIAKELKSQPNYFMQAIDAETARKFRPDTINTKFPFYKNGALDGYATGLIQFIPDVARRLGTTTWDLAKMSATEQLDYVYKYFKPYAGKLNSYFAVYLVIFWPAGLAHVNDDGYIFETKNISRSSVAKANPAVDINKDGVITMGEFKQYVRNSVPKSLWDALFEKKKEIAISGVLALLLIAAAIWWFYFRK